MRKDPVLACLLSFLCVGIGHIYLGRTVKGLVILAIAIVLLILSWGIAIIPLVAWAMYDAYSIAKKLNTPVKKPLTHSGK